jgi:hypothetical protein
VRPLWVLLFQCYKSTVTRSLLPDTLTKKKLEKTRVSVSERPTSQSVSARHATERNLQVSSNRNFVPTFHKQQKEIKNRSNILSDLLLGLPNNEICMNFMVRLLITWKPHLTANSIKNIANRAAGNR